MSQTVNDVQIMRMGNNENEADDSKNSKFYVSIKGSSLARAICYVKKICEYNEIVLFTNHIVTRLNCKLSEHDVEQISKYIYNIKNIACHEIFLTIQLDDIMKNIISIKHEKNWNYSPVNH